jgi:hypothetical protein
MKKARYNQSMEESLGSDELFLDLIFGPDSGFNVMNIAILATCLLSEKFRIVM